MHSWKGRFLTLDRPLFQHTIPKLARYTANIPVNEKWNLVTGEREQIPQLIVNVTAPVS